MPRLSAQLFVSNNAVLAAVSQEEYALLAEQLKLLDLSWRELLYGANATIEYVYFPLDGLASLLMRVDKDSQVEIGAIGREGMLGVPVFLGSPTSPHSAYCQVAGRMACMPARAL